MDACSQPNIICESFIKRHEIHITKENPSKINGIGGGVTSTKFSACLEIGSRFNNFAFITELDVVSGIPYKITSESYEEMKKRVALLVLNLQK